jgi:diguanylate cyclase (GGDEF)-like protein/PAS domain S-box-containing protein
MQPARIADNEQARLQALRALEVLDSEPDQELDALVRVASRVCGTPISLVSLVDESRQWFKANTGLANAQQTPREFAFCAHAILQSEVFEVRDASTDTRFFDNPLVEGDPRIRFYAGAPLVLSNGHRVGTLCVIDTAPKALTQQQKECLADLAIVVSKALESRQSRREARRLALKLDEHQALLSTALKAIGEAVITTDAMGIVDWLNPMAENFSGWSTAQAHGQPLDRVFPLVSAIDRTPITDLVRRCLFGDREQRETPHCLLLARDGRELGIEGSVSPMLDSEGQCRGAVIVFRDVTEQRKILDKMRHQASHDALTGLVNRSQFEQLLEHAFCEARTRNMEHALLWVDLDHFKAVNDTFGHAAGDAVLKQVALELRKPVRNFDVVARLGGDEFALLVRSCSSMRAQEIAQAICERISALDCHVDGSPVRVGASVGIARIHPSSESTAAVLIAADAACYRAKRLGRNRVIKTEQGAELF